jgi:hypothetical protein
MKIIWVLSLFLMSLQLRAGTRDYENMPFLDQNIKVGLGLSYSKLESTSDIGNYFLLSQANPRLEFSYSSPIVNLYRHKFSASVIQETFRPENDTLFIKTHEPQGSAKVAWQPIWLNEEKSFARYFKFVLKNSSVVSELPNLFSVVGDIANRYSLEGGVGFTWYGLTADKFPLSVDAEILYSQNLFDHSALDYYNGFVYRFGFDFEFKKRSIFAGWGLRGFYEFEEIKNGYSRFVDKELGIVINRSFTF